MKGCMDNPTLKQEDMAIRNVFHYSTELDTQGTVIMKDDMIAGFAIGEPLNNNTFVDHFEKADTQFPGIYQFLLHELVKSIPEQYRYINREQDLGIEGLRKAKMAYNPVKMIEKFIIKCENID
jgi:hypothetical protein